jgi:magnesium transporter
MAAEQTSAEPAEVRPVFDDDLGVTSEFLADVVDRLEVGDTKWLRDSASDMWAADVADLIEALDPGRREEFVQTVKGVVDPETFTEVDDDIREAVLEQLEPEELAYAV